jgi:hypothetical protein
VANPDTTHVERMHCRPPDRAPSSRSPAHASVGRVGQLTAATQLIGTTLDVRQILEKVGDAIRLAVEFDTMGLPLFKPDSPDYAFFGAVGEPPVPGVESIPTTEFSYAAALKAGRAVLFDEARSN